MSHHRQHAADFIGTASGYTSKAQEFLSEYIKTGTLNPAITVELASALRAAGRSAHLLTQAALGIYAGDLDEVRAFLNQPNEDTQPRSASSYISIVSYSTLLAVKAGADTMPSSGDLNNVVFSVRSAWNAIDRAIWHVNDAIREEVYNDPAFAETTS